ncbi:MAG: hypothetical protein C0423_12505 [Methylibium sp.]|nr:hypothetical protein [Methylibium sp.]
MRRPSRHPALLWAYIALVLGLGLLQGLAELQHYLAGGGRLAWEPLLWELSSALSAGLLGPAVYRWHVRSLGQSRLQQLWCHAAGAALYVLAHVSLMFGMRFAVYALMGVGYHPGSAGSVLAYEAGKDVASYLIFIAISHGLYLYLRAREQDTELQRTRTALAETQLARLAEQLQPHFLFNTLNLVSSVMYEDVARADRILCQLADLLRQALAAQAQSWQRLEDELRLVEPFLAIMQARFGERLQLRIEATPEARACIVPALLLISPVENAVKHGVAVSSGPVCVSLQARCEQGRLHLRVENSDGSPLPPGQAVRAGALGLSNLQARLRAAYGDEAQCLLAPREGGGACLTLTLPLHAEAPQP